MVGNERQHLERSLAAVARLVEETGDANPIGMHLEWL